MPEECAGPHTSRTPSPRNCLLKGCDTRRASSPLRSKQKGPLSSHFFKNKKTIHTHSFAQWDVYGAFTRTNKCAGSTVTQVKKKKEEEARIKKKGFRQTTLALT